MRILFVAMPDSIHTARWINQLDGTGWDIHLFPSIPANPLHPDLQNLTVYCLSPGGKTGQCVRRKGLWPVPRGARTLSRLAKIFAPDYLQPARWLARVIAAVKPDIVHALEFQHGAYLTFDARKHLSGPFPTWIVTNWGADISLYGQLPEHEERIKRVLQTCDYYSCECHRDVALARKFGYQGEILPVFPNSGGLDLGHIARLRPPGPTSSRRLVVLKGYQHFAGRALVGLRALALCARELKGFRIAVYHAHPDVRLAAELLSRSIGVPLEIIPPCSHEEILSLFGRARIYMGLSIADGICTSFLEAMAMGAFPIQSYTACASEWIIDGETGSIVPPEDPDVVAAALRRALLDTRLVDEAARRNAAVCAARADRRQIRPVVTGYYERILASKRKTAA